MAQPADLVKVTMQFDLNDGTAVVDHAQFGVWGAITASGLPSDWNAALDDLCNGALTGWVADVPETLFSPASVLNGAVAGHYDTSGHLVHERKIAATGGTEWTGSASQSMPWAVTPCVSLYTYTRGDFIANGKSRRGRIYLPPVGTNIMGNTTSAQMSQTNVDNILGYVAAFLSDLEAVDLTSTASSFKPGVLSVALNQFNQLSHLSMDRKLDTQRRREKQQTTVITTQAWP
jgi:hypothetical protein